MRYLLVIMVWATPHSPTIAQIGPFRDLLACEAAAAQSTIFGVTHPTATVQTFCAAEHVWPKPKGIK